jgi:hypothetical protein
MTYQGGILRNKATGRFHPILFRPAPMPGGADVESGALRHKSLAHHTDGLDTLEEAREWLAARADTTDSGAVWDWSGYGTPAMVEWFSSVVPEQAHG